MTDENKPMYEHQERFMRALGLRETEVDENVPHVIILGPANICPAMLAALEATHRTAIISVSRDDLDRHNRAESLASAAARLITESHMIQGKEIVLGHDLIMDVTSRRSMADAMDIIHSPMIRVARSSDNISGLQNNRRHVPKKKNNPKKNKGKKR
jgi:hypothetical protein